MCGRYYTEIDREEMQRIVDAVNRNLAGRPELAEMKTGEIFPTNKAPVYVLAPSGNGPAVTLMQWGFPGYPKSPGAKPPPIINARSETVTSLSMFRDHIGHRCLVPATSYIEWCGEGKPKPKFEFRPSDGSLLYMAGIWRQVEGLSLPVYTILTMPPSDSVKPIHDRMPVIVSTREARQAWLAGEAGVQEVVNTALTAIHPERVA